MDPFYSNFTLEEAAIYLAQRQKAAFIKEVGDTIAQGAQNLFTSNDPGYSAARAALSVGGLGALGGVLTARPEQNKWRRAATGAMIGGGIGLAGNAIYQHGGESLKTPPSQQGAENQRKATIAVGDALANNTAPDPAMVKLKNTPVVTPAGAPVEQSMQDYLLRHRNDDQAIAEAQLAKLNDGNPLSLRNAHEVPSSYIPTATRAAIGGTAGAAVGGARQYQLDRQTAHALAADKPATFPKAFLDLRKARGALPSGRARLGGLTGALLGAILSNRSKLEPAEARK